MAAGAAPYLSAVMSAYVAFLLPALLPPAVLLLLQGGNIYVFMGLMMLVFSGAMLTIGRAIHLTIKDSLTLRFENITLTEGLSDAQMEANRASAELAAEIQERKRAQADLFLEKELAQVTLKSIGDGVITTNMDSAVKYLNPVAEQLTGWPNAEAQGLPLQRVLKLVDETTEKAVPDPARRCLEEKRSVRLSGHSVLVHRDGEKEFSVEVTISPIHDHDLHGIGAVLVLHEATEMHGMARRMSYQASHDALTGLVNRHEFELRLTQALKSARTEDRQHALCYLDLDQFKAVNDMCGHVAGDALLRQLAAELQRGVRESDTLARLGGDEFGVLLEGCPLDQARKVADGLRQSVQNFRFAWEDRVFEVGMSIGVVPITGDSGSITEVLSMADSACYMAKNRGRDRVHVHEPDDKVMEQRLGEMQWVSRIARAIQEDRIDLFGQQTMPLSAKAKRCGYSEVLIRMQDENGEHVPTTAFLPAAKRYNLMPIIDRWVMRKVCAFLCDVGVTTSSDLGILAINLSGQSLSDERFLDFVVDQLHQNSIPPENI
jgi:diguanylate cyclase (GGDEF)-like protein/PAS domain S-box-containing protein